MERNRLFDIAKGFAIILVILGHTYSFSNGNFILYWINGFHMPFFFIVSGILYGEKMKNVKSLKLKLGCKIKKFLVPYFVFEILFLFYLCCSQFLNDRLTIDFIARKFFAVLNLTGLHSTWFLPCLMIVQIFFCLFIKIGKWPCFISIFCLALFGLLYPCAKGYTTILLRCLVALGFFAMGLVSSRWWQREQKFIIVVLDAVAYCVFVGSNGLVNIVDCTFHNPFLYVGNALLGTFVMLQVSIWLLRVKSQSKIVSFFEYMGRNSIIILCTHAFLIEFFRLVDYKLFHNFLPKLGYFEGLLFTLLILVIEIPVIVAGKRYFSVAFGLREKEQK